MRDLWVLFVRPSDATRRPQVVSTCDYATSSRLWSFLSIGLNCQVGKSLRT